MSTSRLRRTSAARICGYAVLGVAIVATAGAGCGGSKPGPTPVTTTVATTTVASTSTTTVPANTSTTTTSIGVLDARIDLQNTPCVAPGSGAVSCTFTGSGSSGGRPPYTFAWRFTNFANAQVVTATGQNAQPELGCNFLAGVATFNVRAELTIRDTSNAANTDTRDVQVARAAGACGT
jgi:hypothetical protein